MLRACLGRTKLNGERRELPENQRERVCEGREAGAVQSPGTLSIACSGLRSHLGHSDSTSLPSVLSSKQSDNKSDQRFIFSLLQALSFSGSQLM